MNIPRRCCRPGCRHYAVATMTFVYSDSTAVVGPLATAAEPHSWDLCFGHASGITAPRGWDLVRHPGPWVSPEEDDLIALAEAVREGESGRAAPVNGWYPQAGATDSATRGAPATTSGAVLAPLAPPAPSGKSNGRRRGHLRVLPDPSD
ncbi:MAG: DUF3499 domain-containing protein [Mycobacterium sp.]